MFLPTVVVVTQQASVLLEITNNCKTWHIDMLFHMSNSPWKVCLGKINSRLFVEKHMMTTTQTFTMT